MTHQQNGSMVLRAIAGPSTYPYGSRGVYPWALCGGVPARGAWSKQTLPLRRISPRLSASWIVLWRFGCGLLVCGPGVGGKLAIGTGDIACGCGDVQREVKLRIERRKEGRRGGPLHMPVTKIGGVTLAPAVRRFFLSR